MRELYTLELTALVKELKRFEGFYIDQFYELGKNRFRFKLSKRGEKENVQLILPNTLNSTQFIEIKEEATNFTIAMRRRIAGFLISSIEQYNNDRIIIIKTSKGEEELSFVLEMYGKGNMVLVDKSMKIILAYHSHQFKDRTIKPNSIYAPPQNRSIDINDRNAIESVISDASRLKENLTLLSYLTKRLGMGSMYIEEAVKRSGIETSAKVPEVSASQIKALHKHIIAIIDECMESLSLLVYSKDDSIIDFSMCAIQKYSEHEVKAFKSMEEGLDYIYSNVKIEKEETNQELERLKASIEKQKAILNEIDMEILENKEKGNYVMSHMHEINGIIQSIKTKKNPKVEDIEIPNGMEATNINLKDKTVRIKTEE